MKRLVAALFALGAIAGVARAAGAATLDPFRGAAKAPAALDPFRVAQALPVPPAEEPASKPSTRTSTETATSTGKASDPSSSSSSSSSPSSSSSASPAPKACQKDDDCPEGNICQANACKAIELSTNLFPIYYREGSFKEIGLVYWARKGNPGYTVVFPFYWHFYSPTSDSFVIAPFYWHFTDSARGSELTVIIPFSWSHEPGARSFAIWPLFYASSKFGWAVPFLLTFKVGDASVGKSFGAVLGLYWWKRSNKGAFDIGLLPPYVSTRNEASAFTYVAPLNFYWRSGDDKNLLVLPLFYKNTNKNGSGVYTLLGYDRKEGLEESGNLFWLYWFGKDDAEHTAYHVVFPLFWRFTGGQSQSTVFFPLVWSFGGPKSNTTLVVPLFLHYRNEGSYFNALFPVWWSGGDDATGRGFKALIPLFFWQRDSKAGTATLVTPLGGYTKDEHAGTFTGFILPLLTYWHHDPAGETKILTPLYMSHHSKTEHSTTRLALLFYQREDPDGSTTTLFPIFWHFRDAATGATATVTPLGGHRSGPRDDTTVITLIWWRHYKPSGWSAGLFPLLFFGGNKGTSHAVVFPLFWHFGSEQETTTALVPLFYRHRDRDGYAFGSVVPLLFMGSHRGESYAIQFPLLWHFASERHGTSTTATPLGYYHSDSDGWSGAVTPFIWFRSGKTRSHFALVPLVWHFADRTQDKTTTVVVNYMHRTWGKETTDAFFPLFHWRRGARPGGDDETSFTIFPFVHYRRDANTSVLATPLYASARGPNRSGGFAGPYIWYDDKELSFRFIPFLHADITHHDTGERVRQYGLWFQMDAPGRKSRVLFPLFAKYDDENEHDTWVAPTYFRMRRNNGDHVDAFVPFYWHSTFGDRDTTVVGPFYDRTAPGVHNFGLAPLLFYARNPERSITVIPPLLTFRRSEHDGENVWHWSILYFHKHDKDSSLTTLFPLYWGWSDKHRETRFFFPVYWHVANFDEKRSWTLAGPLFASDSGTWRTRGLLPLAWYTRDSESGYASNALMPLFYEATGPDHFALFTLLGGYQRSGPSRLWYATPLLWSTDSVQTSFSMLFPLWFRHTDKAVERTTTVIPPVLFVSRTTPEESFTTAAALFWRYRDIGSATTVVLPLFYDVHDYHLSRTTAFFPLFIRHHRDADDATYWVSPFFYSHTTPTYGTTFGFPLAFVPLYWDIRRGNDRTTLVLPLYAQWQRATYRSTLVIPFYYHQEGLRADGAADGTYRRFAGFVIPFYDSGVKRPGDFEWNILGGLIGHETIGHHQYVRFLWFFNVEHGAAPRAQTAWYSQPARTPRKVAARGLNVVGF